MLSITAHQSLCRPLLQWQTSPSLPGPGGFKEQLLFHFGPSFQFWTPEEHANMAEPLDKISVLPPCINRCKSGTLLRHANEAKLPAMFMIFSPKLYILHHCTWSSNSLPLMAVLQEEVYFALQGYPSISQTARNKLPRLANSVPQKIITSQVQNAGKSRGKENTERGGNYLRADALFIPIQEEPGATSPPEDWATVVCILILSDSH